MPSHTGKLGPHTVHRVGFGAMQIPGPGVMGPPKDRAQAVQVVRRAVEAGVNHIDTASYYGPDVANEVLREALDPWPEGLRVVSKVGASRNEQGEWLPRLDPEGIRAQVDDDLRVLGIQRLTAINVRLHGPDHDQEEFLAALQTAKELVSEGKVELVGVSTVTVEQLDLARQHVDVACVQNQYGVLDRAGEEVLAACSQHGIAFVPYFPLGSAFGAAPRPTEDPEVQAIAGEVGATPAQVALAWLLHHDEHVLLIPGTSSLDHLEENLGAGEVELSAEQVARLDALAPPA